MEIKSNLEQSILPWDEILDRLYHRQEPETILEDLVKRGRVREEDLSNTLSLISGMKEKVESFRIGS